MQFPGQELNLLVPFPQIRCHSDSDQFCNSTDPPVGWLFAVAREKYRLTGKPCCCSQLASCRKHQREGAALISVNNSVCLWQVDLLKHTEALFQSFLLMFNFFHLALWALSYSAFSLETKELQREIFCVAFLQFRTIAVIITTYSDETKVI